ncbi:UDP-4-amino-4,6-dideoxy-N-acetyl-beta-L-altrosamine transaminase [Desulfobotulus alkaliphilus]|uniref:UDP-4-amino-4, 6-dideoxy-N-acetyl-beta-L-altrosamine transaminase n=1 Tax=Desulfobotulus alkaliphilus TaxID=622671 RepID=A0A562RTE9_9BACT|nr:UDP-4-amino-4,6-dideoxy-N-acetyl-beta-L-altrosamine transaminase [Desulfobotulus alkaliphilus]TWI71590.1 UDP-4-amino-4,6-dideoxy-N-acetyl-beta-L-altrosamine transaminase [Desulfobotulus alkaliphilus]
MNPSMPPTIPYGRQNISEEDIRAVLEVLHSDYLTQGPKVPEFENKMAAFCGASHALAVNSATSALHLACLALGLGPGDTLWTSPITFVASANCALYCGASVDFVDIDPKTWNLCPNALEKKLKEAEKKKSLPKIVVPVHLCGQPCDMEGIHRLSLKYGFSIIEDAAHATGASYKNEKTGNCRYSDITIFSFHPVKIITTAEGGMAMTNRRALAEKMALLRSHGITRDEDLMTQAPDGPWYYQQIDLGFNYRMTEMQAALGLCQMDRLGDFIKKRRQLSQRYTHLLQGLPLTLPFCHPDANPAWHLYIIRLQRDQISKSHREVFGELRAKGIGVNLHYIPVHTQPYYKNMGFREGRFPESERYYKEAISLPLFPDLQEADQNRVVDALTKALGQPS